MSAFSFHSSATAGADSYPGLLTAVCGYGGAAEYVLAEESMVAPLPRRFQEGEHMLQAPVIAWNMARIFGESPESWP